MANEMDTNRITRLDRKANDWKQFEGHLVDIATARAVDNTIKGIVNKNETELASIREIPLTINGGTNLVALYRTLGFDACVLSE